MTKLSELLLPGFPEPGFPDSSWVKASALDVELTQQGNDWVGRLFQGPGGKLFTIGDFTFRVPKGKPAGGGATGRVIVAVRAKGDPSSSGGGPTPTGVLEVDVAQLEIEVATNQVVAANLVETPYRKLTKLQDKNGVDQPVVFRGPALRLELNVGKALSNLLDPASVDDSPIVSIKPLAGPLTNPTVQNNVPVLSADPPHFVSNDGGIGATCGTARLYLGSEGPGGAADTFRGFAFDQFGVYLNNNGAPDTWSGLVKMERFRLALNPSRVSGKFWTEILHHTSFSPQVELTAWYRTNPKAPELAANPLRFAGGSTVILAAPDAPFEYLLVRLKVTPTWRLPGSTAPDEEKQNLFMKPGGHRVRWTLPPDALPEARGQLDELELGWVRFPPGAHRVEVGVFDPRFADDESQGWGKATVTLVVPGSTSTLRVALEAARTDAKPLQSLPDWPVVRSRLHIELTAGERLKLSARVQGLETNALQATLTCETDGSGGELPITTPDQLLPVPTSTTPRPNPTWTIDVPADLQRIARHGALVVTVQQALGGTLSVASRLRYTLLDAASPGQPTIRLEPEDDWVEAGGVSRIGVRLTNGLRPDDVSWTLESVDAPTTLFSSAADDERFKPGPSDGFPVGGEEQKSFAWSASNIAPYLEAPDQLWRIKASVLDDPIKRPRGPIVVGETATSLRLGAGAKSLPRTPAPVAWGPLYGPTTAPDDDRFILFPLDTSDLGSDGPAETWTPATGILNNRLPQLTRAVQLRGLADLLRALYDHADVIEELEIYGLASSEGKPEHNKELGVGRANAVAAFIQRALSAGPSMALRDVAAAGATLPDLPPDAGFRSRCARLASVAIYTESLGTLASTVTQTTIDTNDRRAFVVLKRSEAAIPAATAMAYVTTLDGAPARHATAVPIPLSASAHPLRHHWLRKARIEVELKDNKLISALAHMLLDASRINRTNLPPPDVDELGKVESNSDLIGFTLAYSETPPASAGGPPVYALVGDVYSPPEDKDGLKAWNPASGQRFLDEAGKTIAGAAITVPAVIALSKNRANAFLGLGAAVAGAAVVRNNPTPGKSLINPTRLVLRGFRLAGGWDPSGLSYLDIGVSYEVSYTVNVDLNQALGLGATDPIKIVVTSDPDTGPGKPITMRLRNVALRIFPKTTPEFRYNPELGFDVDIPDPGLLRISGLNGASAALAKFMTIKDVKIERNNPLSFEGTIDFKFNSGFFKIGGLTFKGNFDPARLFKEGLSKSTPFEVTPTAKAITLGAEIKNVLKGSGEVRIGNPIGGDVDLTLEALKLQLYASFNVWTFPDYTAVYASAGFELSPGFPLWATGLGLQGIDALVGVNVERTDQDPLNMLTWYRGANPPATVGVAVASKWTPKRGAFAFGAGVKIGTLADKGFSWWIKGMLVVQLPGPQIFIAARCGFFTPKQLQPKADSKTEGGLLAVILLDLARNAFYAGVDITLEQKKVFKFQAPVRVFFNLNNARDFYIRFGQISPAGGQLIEMEALEYFRAWGYLQIEGTRFETNRTVFPSLVPPLVLTGPCVAFGFRTEVRIGAPPLAWFQASLEVHAGLQIKPFYIEGSALALGEAGLLGASIQASANVLARAGNDALANREVLYLRIEASFTIRILLWTPPPARVKLEIGRRDAMLPPAHPLVAFSVLPRFQDKALERGPTSALTDVPLDARLRLEFDKVVTDPAGKIVRAGQIDPINRVSDDISYLFELSGLALRETASGATLANDQLWATFPMPVNPGEPAQTLELMSPDPAATLFPDTRSLSQTQIDTLTEQLHSLCAPVPPAPTRAATFDGQDLGPAQEWTLSHIDLRIVNVSTFSTELAGAGWVNQQGGQLADLAAVVTLPTLNYADRRATDRALKLPKGPAGSPAVDIPRLTRRIETTVEQGQLGRSVGIYGDADSAWARQTLSGLALTSAAIAQSFWQLDGPSGSARAGASRLSRGLLLTFPPTVSGRAVVVIKTGSTGGGAIWLDATGAPIAGAALAFSGPFNSAPLAAGSSGTGDFANHEARAIALSSTGARPATALLLVGQVDADSYLIELSGVTAADAAAREATLAQQRASIDQLTTRRNGIYADPLQRANRPLLKPNTEYQVVGSVTWKRLRNGQQEEAGAYDFSQSEAGSLTFRTVAAPRKSIADYVHSVDPPDEALPLYADEPFVMKYRNDTVDELFKRFNQRLVLRAMPARGAQALIAARADVTTRTFEALTPAEQSIEAAVRSSSCLTGLQPGVPRDATNVTGLETDTPYEAALLAVDLTGPLPTDGALVAQLLDPTRGPVWSGRFRTSQFRSFAAHLAAFNAAPKLDMVVDAAAIPGLPASGALLRDDATLEAAVRTLFGGPLSTPGVCEVVRLWAAPATAGGHFQLVGVLLDSPEPFLRRNVDFDQTTIAPVQRGFTGISGTRTLLAVPAAQAPGSLSLTISYRRSSADQAVSQTLSISLPNQPF